MEAAKIQKGSKESNRDKVGKVTWAQVEVIAKDKMEDLNAFTLNSAMSMVGQNRDTAFDPPPCWHQGNVYIIYCLQGCTLNRLDD